MIKAMIRNGRIEPLDPLPDEWSDGRELVIQCLEADQSADWMSEVAEAMADVPAEHNRIVLAAVNEHRREAKEQMHRAMEGS